ncbi:MAG: type II toxin-antitoxin system VapB family antitoxin [Propionibacteriaceae bacterium]|jgi:hypothetical protein|nr:type II toxin-antitoxin system VapB family antitoxin [Propionibacteriaceae bacterium]
MATNLALTKSLLSEALACSGLKTKRATVEQALAEYIARRRAPEIIEMFGTVDYDSDYDYKRLRHRDGSR